MKKLILFLTVLTLAVSAFMATACATELPTPWSDETMKIFILEDFDDKENGAAPMPWEHNSDFTAEYADGKAVINEVFFLGEGGWGYAKLDQYSNAPASNTGVLGYGFYLENNTDSDLAIAGYWIGCDNFVGAGNGTYYTVVDGVVSELTTDEYGAITFASGFKGYFLIPFASHNAGSWSGTATTDATFSVANDYIALSMSSFNADQGNVVIDNYLLYGTSEMEGVSVDSLDTPSDEPSNTPDDDQDDEQNDTGDVSVIAYAAIAAVSGLGALAIKRRK